MQNDVNCGDVVEIKTKCRIPIWRTFGQIQWHTAGCCHLANSMACHPRATYHIAGCCHLVNSLGALKMTDMKLHDMKLTDRVAGHEIAGHENGGPNSRT